MLPWMELLAPEAAHERRRLLLDLRSVVCEVPVFHVASIRGESPVGDLAYAIAPQC
jgi:hypothetical protein